MVLSEEAEENDLHVESLGGGFAASGRVPQLASEVDESKPTSAASSVLSPRWLTIASWAALLTAVFGMSAVGPMFLWLEKQKVPALLAIVWRQTTQCLALLIPTIIEHVRAPPDQPRWWTLRVVDDEPEQALAKARERERKREEAAAAAAARSALAESATIDPDATHVVDTNPSTTTHTTRIDVADQPSDADSAVPAVIGHHPVRQTLLIAFYWTVSVAAWVIALPFTSAARASLFSSLYPIMIVIYLRVVRKVPVSGGEFLGVLVCLLGIASSEALSSLNPDTNTLAAQAAAADSAGALLSNATMAITNATSGIVASGSTSLIPTGSLSVAQLQVVGDLTCIFASVFIALNVVTTSSTRKVVPLFAFTLLTSFAMLMMLLCATVVLEDTTFDRHPTHGVFGWLATEEMATRVLTFGFLVGMVGILGFNFAVSHINAIVFSTVELLDPGISGIMSALFGVEGWPVISTYIGVGVVTIGIFLVVWYQTKRENAAKEDAAYERVELQTGSTAVTTQQEDLQLAERRDQ